MNFSDFEDDWAIEPEQDKQSFKNSNLGLEDVQVEENKLQQKSFKLSPDPQDVEVVKHESLYQADAGIDTFRKF